MKISLVLLWVLAIVACQDNTESLDVSVNDDYNAINLIDKTITPEKAAVLAQVFRTDLLSQPSSTRASEASKGVSTVYAWRSEEIGRQSATRSTVLSTLPDTLLYIVNFEDSCGYALVSANQLIPGVVAYIEEGTLTPNTEIDNPGFQLFLDGYRDYVEEIQNRGSGVIPPSPVPWRLVYNVPPLLHTRWHQQAPYNNYCFTSDGQQAVAGCGAIATGQVVGYHRYPSTFVNHTYNWDAIMQYDSIPSTDITACNSVAEVIHDIGVLIGTDYGVNGSGSQFDSIANCLNAYNYHYLLDHNDAVFDSIRADIDNGYPVIMKGTRYVTENGVVKPYGHAWVVDGVAIKGFILAVIEIPPQAYMSYEYYIHCNWGWRNNDNSGYYIIGAFENKYNLNDLTYEGGQYAFNSYMYTYRHIYPNNSN